MLVREFLEGLETVTDVRNYIPVDLVREFLEGLETKGNR